MCAAKCDVFCESRREVHVVKQALTGYFVCYKSATEARQVYDLCNDHACH